MVATECSTPSFAIWENFASYAADLQLSGIQKGIIGPTLFSMLVLMAIVTTMTASPLFEAVYER